MDQLEEWSTVQAKDLMSAVQQSEHERRPWKEFVGPLSIPPDSNRAVSRLKCNLVYYRNNYAQIVAGMTCLSLIRNPTGAISLAVISAGAALYIDKVAVAASKKAMAVLQRTRPKLAEKIRSSPGGADGLSVSGDTEPVVKVAGMPRDSIANSLLGVGGLTAMLTGAMGTVFSGIFMGAALCMGHACVRPPNTQAKLQNFKRKVITMGQDLMEGS